MERDEQSFWIDHAADLADVLRMAAKVNGDV